MFKRLMKMKEDKKGFTLAELLIVVAIIGVLVAISVPIFTAQLQKAHLATNQANARSAKAAIVTAYLEDSTIKAGTYNCETGKLTTGSTVSDGDTTGDDPQEWKTTTTTNMGKTTYENIGMTLDATAGKEGTVATYSMK